MRARPSASTRADVLADHGATVVEHLPLSGLVRVRLEPGTSVAVAARALEQRPEVRYAQPNHLYRIAATPNDPSFPSLWGMTTIQTPAAWDLTTGSDAVTVAVVDTGIGYTHPDLQANIWLNDDPVDGVDNDANGRVDDLRGWDFVSNDNNPMDDEGHGTHVAGTIGARGNNGVGVTGVNWSVKLMALKAGDEEGIFEEAWIVQAFRYACANGARVINGSFGGPDFPQAILDAINACPGALFVFAAGNDGTNNDFVPAYPCNLPPANVVCVAATTSADVRATFSNYGPNTVDLAAPGVGILSTVPGPAGYELFNGTSMAAPHVAGVAALILSVNPFASAAAVRQALLSGVDLRPGLAGFVATGGRLNAWRPLPPVGLTAGATTAQNVWTNNANVSTSWSGATDPSGIDGYSFSWSPDGASVPDESKDGEENVTSTTVVVPDGRQWFHVRAVDGLGTGEPRCMSGPS